MPRPLSKFAEPISVARTPMIKAPGPSRAANDTRAASRLEDFDMLAWERACARMGPAELDMMELSLLTDLLDAWKSGTCQRQLHARLAVVRARIDRIDEEPDDRRLVGNRVGVEDLVGRATQNQGQQGCEQKCRG